MEFGAGIPGAEAPIDGGLSDVALGLMGGDGSSQSHIIAVAGPQAGSGQYAELDFRHPFGKLKTGFS